MKSRLYHYDCARRSDSADDVNRFDVAAACGQRAQKLPPERIRVSLLLGGHFAIRVCPIRVPFSRVLGTLILERQNRTRRLGLTSSAGRLARYGGNRRNIGNQMLPQRVRGFGGPDEDMQHEQAADFVTYYLESATFRRDSTVNTPSRNDLQRNG